MQVATFPSYITQKIIIIHIKVTNNMDHDVFINVVANYTFIKVDSKVYRIYFYNCRFLESKGEIDLKKMYFASNFVAH